MIILTVGCVIAALGALVAALGVVIARMQDNGGHCKFRRPRAVVIVALGLWAALRSGRALPPPGPRAPAGWPEIAAGMGKPSPEGIGWLCEPNPAAVCDDIRARWDQIRADNPGLPGMRDCCLAFDCEPHWHDCAGADAPIVTDAEVREEFERLAAERGIEVDDRQAVPMSPDPAVRPFTGWRVPDGHKLPGGRGLMFARTPWPTAADPVVPAITDDQPPWDVSTRQQPAIDDAPVYGQAPVAAVLEAQRRYVLAMGPDDGCEEA